MIKMLFTSQDCLLARSPIFMQTLPDFKLYTRTLHPYNIFLKASPSAACLSWLWGENEQT